MKWKSSSNLVGGHHGAHKKAVKQDPFSLHLGKDLLEVEPHIQVIV